MSSLLFLLRGYFEISVTTTDDVGVLVSVTHNFLFCLFEWMTDWLASSSFLYLKSKVVDPSPRMWKNIFYSSLFTFFYFNASNFFLSINFMWMKDGWNDKVNGWEGHLQDILLLCFLYLFLCEYEMDDDVLYLLLLSHHLKVKENNGKFYIVIFFFIFLQKTLVM